LLQIKTATNADIELIHNLGKLSFYPTYLPFISEAQVEYMFDMMYSHESLQQQMNEKQHFFLIAYLEQNAVGFISYELNCADQNACKVHKLYILPNVQTKGLGKLLLEKVVLEALGAQQQSIILNVNRYNKAVHFYKHLGFCIYAEEDIDIGNGYFMNDYEMKKILTA
jgi:diamine N-acetyltransferase